MGTARFALPLLSVGQAQKEFTHNEALQMLDLLAAACVEDVPSDSPPASPAPGTCFLVGNAPTGAWAGRARCLAGYSEGGWRFIEPIEGMTVVLKASGETGQFRASDWDIGTVRASNVVIDGAQVVGSQASAVAAPTGGTTVDVEARAALGSILDALRHHGLIAS